MERLPRHIGLSRVMKLCTCSAKASSMGWPRGTSSHRIVSSTRYSGEPRRESSSAAPHPPIGFCSKIISKPVRERARFLVGSHPGFLPGGCRFGAAAHAEREGPQWHGEHSALIMPFRRRRRGGRRTCSSPSDGGGSTPSPLPAGEAHALLRWATWCRRAT